MRYISIEHGYIADDTVFTECFNGIAVKQLYKGRGDSIRDLATICHNIQKSYNKPIKFVLDVSDIRLARELEGFGVNIGISQFSIRSTTKSNCTMFYV